jgi:DNA-directed RNA polymerase subunit RPC12/RpoP
MGKIQEYIIKHNIKPSECAYHTWRDVKNSKKQIAGKIRVLVPKGSSVAMVEYTCPECKHSAYREEQWKRPFSVKCEKCGFRISVSKMKQEAKKELKGKA